MPSVSSRFQRRALGLLALSLLPLNFAAANVAAESAQAAGSTIDAKTVVLLVMAVAAAWALRIALRRYAQADQPRDAKRQRLQPNL